MPRATIGRAELFYDDVGPRGGETIVFAHGLLWSGAMFAPQIAALARSYRCIAFDFPGQGLSPAPQSGYDMETLTGDVAGLIMSLGCGRCHFVGLSMGGFVGLRLAIRKPELLRSLTLIDSAADAEPRANIPKYRAMLFIARLFGVAPLIKALERIMFGRAFLEDAARADLRAELRRKLLANDVFGMARATMGIIQRASVEKDLPSINTRTLVIHGEGDRAILPYRARKTAAGIRGAELVMIPRAGHTSTLEEPELVTAALSTFIRSVRR